MNIKCTYNKLLEVEKLKLIVNPNNPNKHPQKQIDQLASIIGYTGQRSCIVISLRSGFITKGHGRLMAIEKLGWEKAAVDYQEYENEAQEWADIVADNAIALQAELDMLKINDLSLKMADLKIEMLGIPDFKLIEPEKQKPGGSPGHVEELKFRVTEKGDMWLMDGHRLMCGDSTVMDDVDKLIRQDSPELVLTDPPYEMDTKGGGILGSRKHIKDIGERGLDEFDPATLMKHAKTSVYFHNKALVKKYIELADNWDVSWDLGFYKKENPVPNYGGHLMSDTEYIAIIGSQKPNKGLPKELYSKCFIGKKDQDNPISYSKPIELCEKFILLYSDKLVLDLFGGTGSTLIAAHMNDRRCLTMEIDPKFCDIIINRWQKFTGKSAVLESTQKTFDEMKQEREKGTT